MENTQLLKNIAELEARCFHLESYVNKIMLLNKDLIQPTKEQISSDLEEKRENAKEKYGVK